MLEIKTNPLKKLNSSYLPANAEGVKFGFSAAVVVGVV